MPSRLHAAALAGALAAALTCSDVRAFPHIVQAGETLAQIAERVYGRVEMEKLLVVANGLDAGAGIPIVPGMRLEIPAVGHRRVRTGETWPELARELLGRSDRSDVLSTANGSMPWLTPADGQEIVVPYALRVVAGQGDTTLGVAYRFLGDRDKAWMLDRYNSLKGDPIRRGDVLLVPLTDLALTDVGRQEAASAGATVRAEALGRALDAQRHADGELPLLAADVRAGRYVDAVGRGNRLLGTGELTRPQLAAAQRHLTEAFVALDAWGLAETACAAWREADPSATLDPVELSPKILRACAVAQVRAPPDAGAPARPGVAAPARSGSSAP